MPTCTFTHTQPRDAFLVLASDGLFEVMTPADVCTHAWAHWVGAPAALVPPAAPAAPPVALGGSAGEGMQQPLQPSPPTGSAAAQQAARAGKPPGLERCCDCGSLPAGASSASSGGGAAPQCVGAAEPRPLPLAQALASRLVEEAYNLGSMDNLAVAVLCLGPGLVPLGAEEEGVGSSVAALLQPPVQQEATSGAAMHESVGEGGHDACSWQQQPEQPETGGGMEGIYPADSHGAKAGSGAAAAAVAVASQCVLMLRSRSSAPAATPGASGSGSGASQAGGERASGSPPALIGQRPQPPAPTASPNVPAVRALPPVASPDGAPSGGGALPAAQHLPSQPVGTALLTAAAAGPKAAQGDRGSEAAQLAYAAAEQLLGAQLACVGAGHDYVLTQHVAPLLSEGGAQPHLHVVQSVLLPGPLLEADQALLLQG